jgi:protease II
MTNHKWVVKKQQEIPTGYDPAQYTSERLRHSTGWRPGADLLVYRGFPA